jgi:CheY-like chemotaxis protein
MVVDDNEDAAELLAEGLRHVGCTVALAYDGPSAVALAAQFCPEVVLLDIGLPVMDGYEVARQLKHGGPGGPRLIALTGYGQREDRDRATRAGFDAHLVKPVDLSVIIATVSGVADPP